LGAVLLTFVLQLGTIYVPTLNPVFNTEPLTGQELVFCLAASTIVFIAVEVEKVLRRRGWI
jgi:Ca2+-transporting ATPase